MESIHILFFRKCLKMTIMDGNTLRVFVNEPIHIVNHVEEHHRNVKDIRTNAFGSIVDAFRSGYVDLFKPPKTNEYWSRFGFINSVYAVDDIDNNDYIGTNSILFEPKTGRERWPHIDIKIDPYTRVAMVDPSSYVAGKEVVRKIIVGSNMSGIVFGVYHFKTKDPYKILRKLSRHPLLLSDSPTFIKGIPATITVSSINELPFVLGLHRASRGMTLYDWQSSKR